MEKEELIQKLKLERAIKTKKTENAIRQVNRENYIPEFYKKFAYIDQPLPIDNKQTISAPHIVALMAEILDVKPKQKILEVGTGSGYLTAVLLQMLKGKGQVYTIERIKELSKQAEENLKTQEYENYEIITGDGSKGLKDKGPFDRIIVSASAKKIPSALIEQLKTGGKLLIPIGTKLYLFEKKSAKNIIKEFKGFLQFVPLIEE